MTIQTLKAFFMWCVILNGSLLILTSLICAFAGDWVYRLTSHWFPVSKEAFRIVIYSFVGLFKLFVLMFNVVPYIALLILG